MTEYLVAYRKASHNDEWENRYEAICIRDEHGAFVTINNGMFEPLAPGDVIEVVWTA